jgi:hypothetical protein
MLLACILLSSARAVAATDVHVGQYFWVNPGGREILRSGIYSEPADGAYQPHPVLDGRSRMRVVEIRDKWAKIRFDDGYEAWVYLFLFENSNLVLREDPKVTEQRRLDAERARQRAAKEREEARAREAREIRDRLISAQAWPERIKLLVRAGKIEKGMHPEMVRLALGDPRRITETDIGSARKEEWNYGGGTILFFGNDRLIGWQREK